MAKKNKANEVDLIARSEEHPVEIWWRTYSPDELRKYRDDPVAIRALAKYLQTDPDEWFKEDGALASDRLFFSRGLIKTGLERLKTNIYSDVSGTWFLLAHLFDPRNSLANMLLREMLMKMTAAQATETGLEAPKTARVCFRLAREWTALVQSEPKQSLLEEDGIKALNSRWRELSEDDWFSEGRRSLRTKREVEEEPEEEEVEVAEGPTRIVVAEIGDQNSMEGKRVLSAYERLVGPLPLTGGSVSSRTLKVSLEMEFPWMGPAIDRLVGDLLLLEATGTTWCRFRPLLLVGPPGVGKTRFARRLARFIGTGFQEINAAGASDNRMLAGTARGWSGAQPALPLLAMLRGNSANPVCVVDEIDKAGGNERNGDMRATLLTMLEPETSGSWNDECLLAKCDLSQVSWILTANSLEGLSAPLLSRVMVIHVDVPKPEHFDALFDGIMFDLCQDLSVTRGQLPELEVKVIEVLREHFQRKRSARKLKNAITAAMAHSMVSATRRLH